MSAISLCKTCENRDFDFKQGIVCNLTSAKPTFSGHCPDFIKDLSVKEYQGLKLRPNDERSSALVVILWIVLLLEVLIIISSGMQHNLLSTIAGGGYISDEAASFNDLRVQLLAVLYLLAYAISGVAFIMWFRRAYFNLHQKVNTLSYGEEWAAGSWFVPFLNLYRPFQIMQELYTETKKYILNRDDSRPMSLANNYLGLWWTLWLVNGIFGQIAFRVSRHASTLDDLIISSKIDIISSVIGVGLGLITIKIVKDYARVESFLLSKS